jgi:hypothetical protein
MTVEPQFVILTLMGNTPSMATCARCQMKFFTPRELIGYPREAEEYMRDKFVDHQCAPPNPNRIA